MGLIVALVFILFTCSYDQLQSQVACQKNKKNCLESHYKFPLLHQKLRHYMIYLLLAETLAFTLIYFPSSLSSVCWLLIFFNLLAEGTTTNGDFLLPFKTGAFLAKAPVLPVILRYSFQRFSPAWESMSGVSASYAPHPLLLTISDNESQCNCCIHPIRIDLKRKNV